MTTFAGFPSGKIEFIRIPEPFFSELLPKIDHLGELKITLFALWFLDRQEASVRYLTYQDFINANLFTNSDQNLNTESLDESITRAMKRGTILSTHPIPGNDPDAIFFLNTPRGRAAINAYQSGDWLPEIDRPLPELTTGTRPNIFRLYEENIGPLTPLMADTLQEAENTYPMEWIEEAIEKAVHNNVRKWRYIEAILGSWKEKGHDEKIG